MDDSNPKYIERRARMTTRQFCHEGDLHMTLYKHQSWRHISEKKISTNLEGTDER